MRTHRQPLSGLRLGAYRPQRRWQVADVLDRREGYAHRLPPSARRWLEGFLLEAYAVESSRIRTGLHADRLKPEHVARLPRRMRRWWGRQRELWPALATEAAAALLGLTAKELDSTRRRELYGEQNRATRDVYSLGRVVYVQEEGEE